MYAVQAIHLRVPMLESDMREKGGRGLEFALEFFGGFDFRLGYAEGVAVVYVELHFVENVGDDFVGLDSFVRMRFVLGRRFGWTGRTLDMSPMDLALYAARAFALEK